MDRLEGWHSASGRRARERMSWLALRPSLEGSWIVGCACLAARSSPWSAVNSFRILTAWLIADVVCGCIADQLLTFKKVSEDRTAPDVRPSFTLFIPYALPGSPGQRLVDRCSELISQWRGHAGTQVRRCGLTAFIGTGLALVLATYMGRAALAALSGGLLLIAASTALAKHGDTVLEARLEGLRLALAWTLGYLALGSLRVSVVALAGVVGLHAYAWVRLRGNQQGAARAFLWMIWAILISALLVARQPILAVLVAVAGIAEDMSHGAPSPQGDDEACAGRLCPSLSWLLSVLLVALAFPYWA